MPRFHADAEDEVCILDSSGDTEMGSFVEQQLALIVNTKQPDFTVLHFKAKTQEEGINECGPLAIAFATELAFTSKLSYVDFNISELRPHLI